MRIGIIGTGAMGRAHAAAWSQTPAAISGYFSKDRPSADSLVEQFGGRVFPDLAALLAESDVVDVCAPTHRHHEIVLAAAAAGKDIVCEKPLARTLAQAQEMIAACQAAGVKLIVAQVVRFFPEYAAARAQVVAGTIGAPAVIRLKRGAFQPKKAADNWFLDSAKSGGLLLDMMIHDLDYARWVAGEVKTVFAKSLSTSQPGAPVDHGLAILSHESGAISHIESSWAYPPPLFRTQLEIAGSNGWLRYDSDETAAVTIHLHQSEGAAPDVPIPTSPLAEDPYTTEIKSFYECLAHGKPNPVPGKDGLAALQLALAAVASAESGRPVTIEPLPEMSG